MAPHNQLVAFGAELRAEPAIALLSNPHHNAAPPSVLIRSLDAQLGTLAVLVNVMKRFGIVSPIVVSSKL